ncbi:hypothetical protein CMK11_03150 [Candidatus Poribacteria bacterium]|nr:hypothetical protein [Candidatus Poribacteria bacterium]
MKTSIRAQPRHARGSDEHPLRWAFEEGSRIGFDGLELCMPPGGARAGLAATWTPELIESTRGLCSEFGMSIFSLSSDWAWQYAAFFPELSGWERGAELIADDATLARSLGAHTILVHFGTSRGPWDDCRAVVEKIAAAAEETGIVLGYEANIWERLGYGGLDSLCRMVDEVGSDHFGVYLHNAYPRGGLPLHEEIDVAGDRLVQAMHSSSLTGGRVEIDFARAFEAMAARFADGAYTFEVPWGEAEANLRHLDRMVADHG